MLVHGAGRCDIMARNHADKSVKMKLIVGEYIDARRLRGLLQRFTGAVSARDHAALQRDQDAAGRCGTTVMEVNET